MYYMNFGKSQLILKILKADAFAFFLKYMQVNALVAYIVLKIVPLYILLKHHTVIQCT